MRNLWLFTWFLLAISLVSCTSEYQSEDGNTSDEVLHLKPEGTDASLGLAGYAKVLCSAVFVSGRDPEAAAHQSGYFLLPDSLQDEATYEIDRENKIVRMNLGDSLVREAGYYGDQGCIIHKGEEPYIHFDPVEVNSTLPSASETPWPMGDVLADEGLSKEMDSVLLSKAVDQAFDPPDGLTAAFIVVHQGRIVAERYDHGADMHMQLESWSMGKSLTATLIGRMIQLGHFGLDDKAPVEVWQSPGDPRSQITIRHLLQMSSGLDFTAHRDPEADEYTEYLDHFYIYTGAVDAFRYSIHRPLEFPVGTEGRYRNCDPLTLGYIMREELGDDYWTFPQQELFDKIGIRRQVLETDPYGNFLLTGYDYGTARNWARLGLLYLQKGMWNGERILPEGFAEFVSSPAPAWDEPEYGGLFWLNNGNMGKLPSDAYFMAGAGGQFTIIVPSLDLVIVRMGHFRGADTGTHSLLNACNTLMEAFR